MQRMINALITMNFVSLYISCHISNKNCLNNFPSLFPFSTLHLRIISVADKHMPFNLEQPLGKTWTS